MIPSSFSTDPEGSYQEAVITASGKVRIAFSPDQNGLSLMGPAIVLGLRGALAAVERNGGSAKEVSPDLSAQEQTYQTLRGLLWASTFKREPGGLTRHFMPALAENTA